MSSSLFKSLLSNWGGLLFAGIVGILIAPLVINSLGEEIYGVWVLVISITGQCAILDFGVRNALIVFVPEARRKADQKELSQLVSTSTVILLGLSLLALGLLLCLLPFASVFFSLPSGTVSLFKILLVLSACDAANELAFGAFNGALAGSERYDILNVSNSLRLFANAVLVVIALKSGLGVVAVASIALLTRLAQRFSLIYYTRELYPALTVRLGLAQRDVARKIVGYGFWASLIVLAGRVVYQIDAIVIGIFIGPAAVTVYAIPAILIDQFRMFAQSGNAILVPRLATLENDGRAEERRTLILKWSYLSELLAIGVGLPLLIAGPKFVTLWMGKELPDSGLILQLLVFPFFVTLPAFAFGNFLFASKQHPLLAKLQTIEAICNLVCSVLGAKLLGVAGVALGTLLPSVLFTGFILPLKASSLCNIRLTDYAKHVFRRGLPLLALYGVSLLLFQVVIPIGSWASFLIDTGVPFLMFGVTTWRFFLPSEERAYIRRRLPTWMSEL